jgi:hypothetical protein
MRFFKETTMDFDAEWLTLGKHRVRFRSTRGFPTETLRTVADVARLAIENNMSARARLVEVVFRDLDKAYDVFVGTTVTEGRIDGAGANVKSLAAVNAVYRTVV